MAELQSLNCEARDSKSSSPDLIFWMYPLISSRASSLVRVIFSCLQEEGRRDWLCLTSRCEHRTLVGSPCPFLPPLLLLPLGRSHWLALVM